MSVLGTLDLLSLLPPFFLCFFCLFIFFRLMILLMFSFLRCPPRRWRTVCLWQGKEVVQYRKSIMGELKLKFSRKSLSDMIFLHASSSCNFLVSTWLCKGRKISMTQVESYKRKSHARISLIWISCMTSTANFKRTQCVATFSMKDWKVPMIKSFVWRYFLCMIYLVCDFVVCCRIYVQCMILARANPR